MMMMMMTTVIVSWSVQPTIHTLLSSLVYMYRHLRGDLFTLGFVLMAESTVTPVPTPSTKVPANKAALKP